MNKHRGAAAPVGTPLRGVRAISSSPAAHRSEASSFFVRASPLTHSFPLHSLPLHTRLFRRLLTATFLCWFAVPFLRADETPWSAPALSVETGLLWEHGSNTPLSYRLVPTQFSWRSREFIGRALSNGGRIVVRHRLTLLGLWVQQGPESHYLAVTASPSIELWNPAATWALVGGAGGGFGIIDSSGPPGGQGQDFTLNFFGRLGIEHVLPKRRSLTAGFLFQHLSNGGMTKINPGIDAFGFTLGYSWSR